MRTTANSDGTALIVRLDVLETHGGYVWTIYWQGPDGE